MTDSADGAEALDPRVQVELERLNTATDEINRLEVELDEARLAFRRLLAEGHLRIQQLTKKLGTSVHKARPYYEARFRVNITSQELQAANVVYDKANSAHSAAREMVFLAEQGLSRLAEGSDGGVTLDPAWQEMLNHATARVNQAESERAQATVLQRTRSNTHRAATSLVLQLQANLKRHIAKSRPYFEEKARINTALEYQKARIQTLERQVGEAKQKYSAALRNLEKISEDIHSHRLRRQSCKNAELPQPKIEEDESIIEDQVYEICQEDSRRTVAAWLNNVDETGCWTDVDLASSPEEVSFEKCSLRPHSASEKSSPPSPLHAPGLSLPANVNHNTSKVSANSPRRIIRSDRAASLRAELDKGRRPSLDALLHDTGEKVKEMFQGLNLFGERRSSECVPQPRPPRSAGDGSSTSDERFSDTDSMHSVEMLTDEQIASLMLDAQLEAACERLAGVGVKNEQNGTRY